MVCNAAKQLQFLSYSSPNLSDMNLKIFPTSQDIQKDNLYIIKGRVTNKLIYRSCISKSDTVYPITITIFFLPSLQHEKIVVLKYLNWTSANHITHYLMHINWTVIDLPKPGFKINAWYQQK